MIQTLQAGALKKIPTIEHAFFTRLGGGVSLKQYTSLNCAYASEDNPEHVKENRRRALAHLGFKVVAYIGEQFFWIIDKRLLFNFSTPLNHSFNSHRLSFFTHDLPTLHQT